MKPGISSERVVAFATALVILAITVAAISVAVALTERRERREHIQLVNRSAVDLAAQGLRSELDEVRGDALMLAQPLAVAQVLAAHDAAERARVERLFVALAHARGDYAQIRLIDSRGVEVVRVNTDAGGTRAVPVDRLQDKSGRPYVKAISALGPDQVHVTRLDLNIEHGQIVHPLEPTLRVGAAVFDASGRRLGIVVINLDGRRLLARIAQDARLAEGAVWLVDREGNWLIGPDPEREWRFMTPARPPAGLATDLPAVWAVVHGHDAGQQEGSFGLLTFDRITLGGPVGNVAQTPVLRIVALSPPTTLAGILLDRSHLLYYTLLLPILLLLAGWLSYLRTGLAGARGEIAANSRLLHDIFTHSDLSMKVKDLQGRIVRANATAGRLLGRPPEELIGRTIDMVATTATAATVRAHDKEVIEKDEVTTYEEQVEYIGGAHTLLTTRFPVTDERNRVVGVGSISVDITERTRMEQCLRLARDQAQAANVTKATFLANMSHELRTPLNSIIGLGELLIDQAGDSGGEVLPSEPLRRIVGAGHHLLTLINDILDIAKVEVGRIDLRPVPLVAVSLIESMLGSMQPLASANGNELTMQVLGDPGIVQIDVVRLRQVLLNLIGNAIKFTRNGSVVLSVNRIQDTLHIDVADTGIGMTEEQLTRIFEPFEQADHSISRRFGGSGLGLAISRQLAEMMGGRIDVISTSGNGSVFSLTLPVGTPAAQSAGAISSADATLSPGAPRQAVVLVVDDDADARTLIQTTLERDGLRVITAASGTEALALVRGERPAVMVLDILLGDMSGWDVLTLVRADPAHAELPVILCTITDPEHRTVSLGVIEHLTKPIDRDQLKTLVRRFVGSEDPVAVMVVDDDNEYREQLALTLQQQGHRVVQAADGEQALLQMRQHPPELVLLDLIMPGLGGMEVIRAMQDDPALAAIPVVLITAADVPEPMLEQLSACAILLIRKGEADHAGIARKVYALVARLGQVDPMSDGS